MPLLPESFASKDPARAEAPMAGNASTRAPLWQIEMQGAFRTLESLLAFLELDPSRLEDAVAMDAPRSGLRPAPVPPGGFPLLVPRGFASRMKRGDWRDPLLLQVLPQNRENQASPGFLPDAVGDLASQVVPGLLHKYASRALLMVSHQCAVHCRYCFRREFPYGDLPRGQTGWEEAWAYIESAHGLVEGSQGLDELVLSGGDPLFLDNRRLERILERAVTLPHIKTIRFHTRLPIVLPSRVEPGLLALLRSVAVSKTLVVVVHANHANEIDAECEDALNALRGAGAVLLNQAVLLAGINDDVDALADLSRALLRSGTLPYYLHQLDRVIGTAHFEVAETRGLALIEALRAKLPGYAVPRYVRESAGEPNKTPIAG